MPEAPRLYSLSELSERYDLELRGDGSHHVDGVGTLTSATSTQITFLANPAYRKALPTTRAGAVILKEADAANCPVNCLLAADPYVAYARLAGLFDRRPAAAPGVHETAVVSPTAKLGRNVSIAAHVVIGEDCVIGDACTIGAGTVLYEGCLLEEACHLHARVTLGHGVRLG